MQWIHMPAHRCGHRWCSDCRTKNGYNRGNRRVRRNIRGALLQFRKEQQLW